MQLRQKQLGLGSVGWLFVLTVGGFALLCLFRLGPVYMDDRAIQGSFKNLAERNPDLTSLRKSEIRSQLSKYNTINGIRSPGSREIDITRKKDKLLINNQYEVRVPLFYNIDVVLSFENQLDSENPDKCCDFLIREKDKKEKK